MLEPGEDTGAPRGAVRAVAGWSGSDLPHGVEVLPLQRHADARGDLVELFRATWDIDVQPVQWNLMRNRPGTLRGVHAHWRHEDYLVPVAGPMWLALKDIRHDSPTLGAKCELDLHGDRPVAVRVPPGVAHGFYFASESMFLFGVSSYWDTEDELACAWNDPVLGFGWAPLGDAAPTLSSRDAEAGSLAVMTAEWHRRRRTLADD
jgi:dTDP-4-dehydrorhamnose 3,5-epimerase